MIHQFLQTLQDSSLSQAILTGIWWFPLLLCFHALGMAFLAGTLMMMDLRLLGVAPRIALQPLGKYFTVVWLALIVNLGSGILLFIGYAIDDYDNTDFRIKILLIILGLIIARRLQRTVFAAGESGAPGTGVPRAAKVLAIISLLCWVGAITYGRLVAFSK
ncbi:MAG: DUF6644 family protein [Steroidobacteraceae bacterium]